MNNVETQGNWMWYIRQVKEGVQRTLVQKEYRDLLTTYYMKGVPFTKAIEDFKSE